jgi:hypothetical protein
LLGSIRHAQLLQDYEEIIEEKLTRGMRANIATCMQKIERSEDIKPSLT